MNQKIKVIMAAAFISILVLPSLVWGILSAASPSLIERLDYGLSERREMSSLPEEFDPNTFPADIETWYTERVPFGSLLIRAGQKIERAAEGFYLAKIQPVLFCLADGGQAPETEYLAPEIIGEDVILGRSDWLFYSGNDSVSYYKGTNIIGKEQLEGYASIVNHLQKLCDERGIRLQLMIVPNKEQIYSEYMPSYAVATPKKRTERLVEYLQENSDCSIIYPIEELKAETPYWQTYFKYDTHWNPVGAFIGTQALYEALGMPSESLQDLDISVVPREEAGDLVLLGELDPARYADDLNYFFYYKPEVYAYATEGNAESMVYRAVSQSGNECRFVMLSDSFRISMLPYLEKDFTDIVVAHRDSADSIKDSIKEADVLVLMAAERYDDRLFDTAQKVITILEEGTTE